MALMDGGLRQQADEIAAQVKVINLVEDLNFTTAFTAATLFPDPAHRSVE